MTDQHRERRIPPVDERRKPCQHCGDEVLAGGLVEAHEDVCEENPTNE